MSELTYFFAKGLIIMFLIVYYFGSFSPPASFDSGGDLLSQKITNLY